MRPYASVMARANTNGSPSMTSQASLARDRLSATRDTTLQGTDKTLTATVPEGIAVFRRLRLPEIEYPVMSLASQRAR